MPMAGEGRRFHEVGVSTPKPYIDLLGRPIFAWALESALRSSPSIKEVHFVIQDSHERDFGVIELILSFFSDAKIVRLPQMTGGALETALHAVKEIENSNPVLINDCDHFFKTDKLDKKISEIINFEIDGFLANFESSSPAYSYAQFDDSGFLIKTAEKEVISTKAIAGMYGFKSKDQILELSNSYINSGKYSESYVSGLFNEIVQRGGKVIGFDLFKHVSFGTPDEFKLAESILMSEV